MCQRTSWHGINLEEFAIDLELANSEVEFLTASIEQLANRAKAELEALRLLADRVREEVATLERSIAGMTVTAPRAGTVLYKQNWRGEKKKIGDRCWRNETVIQIPDLSTLVARAEVDEADAARLLVGQSVELQLDALAGKSWKARVVRVGGSVQERSWRDRRRVVKLDLALDRLDTKVMRPGMRFVGELDVSSTDERAVGAAATGS